MRRAFFHGVALAVVPMAATVGQAQSLPVATQSAAPVATSSAARMNLILFRLLPVQYAGRIMPVDTLARQVVRQVTGRRTWADVHPAELFLAWTWSWPQWEHEPMVLVGHPDLQKHLGLPPDRKHFSFADLVDNAELTRLATQARRLAQDGQPIDPLQQAALQVQERLYVLNAVRNGSLLRIIPAIQDPQGTWTTVAEIDNQPGLPPDKQEQIRLYWQRMGAAFLAHDRTAFIAATHALDRMLTDLKAASWPDRDALAWEFVYNWLQLFHWGWIATFVATAIGLLAAAWPKKWIKAIAWALLLDGFALLTAGILIRWRLRNQTPPATVHDTLVFLGWSVTAIGIIAMILVRRRTTLPLVAGIATAILVVADAVCS